MKKLLTTFQILLFAVVVFGQVRIKNTGVPYMRFFGPEEYGNAAQNWMIKQDSRGIIYVGNSGGLMIYNGSDWNQIIMPNSSVVRSITFDSKGKIFVGAQNEFGYIKTDSIGRIVGSPYKIVLK